MKNRSFLLILAAIIWFALSVYPVYGAEITEKQVIYQTDFSSSPGWITNSPSHYYWDGNSQMYYFNLEGGTNGNSYVPIDYDEGSFTLEFDVILKSYKKNGAFRFGVTSSEMDVARGTNVLSVFEYGKYGKLMFLRVIDQNNHFHEVSSLYSSYCGSQTDCETVEFVENKTYHVIIKYNEDLQNANIKISDKESGELIWGYYVTIGQDLHFLSRLAITSKGDYTTANNVEGYLDNVEMYTFRTVVVTTTPTTPAITFTP
ncbi:MAG TPA: hypothetical protein VMW63_05720, partial [Methanoregulaceae archaeon]|nr:hypothetical protein [Methanoregulaceae archaeon]